MDDYSDIFDAGGELDVPTVRGSANLDVQDYQGYNGSSEILDNELFEDTPSRPGQGAGPASDVEGLDRYSFLEDPSDEAVTDFGASPWGPGAKSGYRPYAQQRADMDLRALGGDDPTREPSQPHYDDMHDIPEVIDAQAMMEALPWKDSWHGNRNQMPSNEDVDPMTLYDRSSYERTGSSQNVIGSGIFEMEEGVTWRPRDGMFANQYAEPAYIGQSDELGVEQSPMWDSTAGNWRVTQPTASGVTLARKVKSMKPMPAGLRPEVTGPRSHIEAFGRKAAKCLIDEAKCYRVQDRSKFLIAATEAVGPGSSEQARKVADALIAAGYRQDVAFEDSLAHLMMHAVKQDLTQRGKKSRTMLPRLDRVVSKVQRKKGDLREAASEHIAPLVDDNNKLRDDLGRLYASPSVKGMGAFGDAEEPAPAEATSNGSASAVFTPRNLAIGAFAGLGVYLLYSNRDTIRKNIKKVF